MSQQTHALKQCKWHTVYGQCPTFEFTITAIDYKGNQALHDAPHSHHELVIPHKGLAPSRSSLADRSCPHELVHSANELVLPAIRLEDVTVGKKLREEQHE
ncbi:hypothetical protein F511_16953 [Dorcoceras hygrometricum]|uniref:Uncharacterized protein n=1 Tax=Dorcoceras hygrometricum TaxID=472368 RepID=A0A2Z7BD19_9LAMI|nr:hypothetical protein F511_16953 [Dorcoceras hygrometricum]